MHKINKLKKIDQKKQKQEQSKVEEQVELLWKKQELKEPLNSMWLLPKPK